MQPVELHFIPIRGRACTARRPRPPSGSMGHPQKDDYYIGTSELWESVWFLDESHKILYWVSFRTVSIRFSPYLRMYGSMQPDRLVFRAWQSEIRACTCLKFWRSVIAATLEFVYMRAAAGNGNQRHWSDQSARKPSCCRSLKCSPALPCWNIKSLPYTLRIAGSSVWRHYDVIKQHRGSQ